MNEFLKVGQVRNEIMSLLNKNGMILRVRNGKIVVERLQIKTTDLPVYVELYERYI